VAALGTPSESRAALAEAGRPREAKPQRRPEAADEARYEMTCFRRRQHLCCTVLRPPRETRASAPFPALAPSSPSC